MKAVDRETLEVSVISTYPSSNGFLPRADSSTTLAEADSDSILKDRLQGSGSPPHARACNGNKLVDLPQASVKNQNNGCEKAIVNGKSTVGECSDSLQARLNGSTSLQDVSAVPRSKISSSPTSPSKFPNCFNISNSCSNGIVPKNKLVNHENLPISRTIVNECSLPLRVCNGSPTGLLNRVVGRNVGEKEPVVNGVLNNGYCKEEDEKHSLESLTDVEPEDGRRTSTPPEDIPCYPGLQVDSGLESAASSWDHGECRLRDELRRTREDLQLRDQEVLRLSRIRQDVEAELEDLTASLFQEAHAMVRVANERQAAAEKALRESSMQVEVLTAEVAALKALVLTSTPSQPNPHLHPQIDQASNSGNTLFRKHRRSPSHFNLKYGRENSPPESPAKDSRPAPSPPAEPVDLNTGYEVDPVTHKEFMLWKQNPTTEQSDPFIARVYEEDINSCLAFSNCQLAKDVQAAVESGTVFIEAIHEKAKTHFPKKCALLEVPRLCQYRMRLGDADTWHSISHMCRNRIIAVCDFLNYLKYIQRGLVKSSDNDIYWEIMKLRKEMLLARLGLPLSS